MYQVFRVCEGFVAIRMVRSYNSCKVHLYTQKDNEQPRMSNRQLKSRYEIRGTFGWALIIHCRKTGEIKDQVQDPPETEYQGQLNAKLR